MNYFIKIFTIVTILIFLSGCSFLPKRVETQRVEVPVYQEIPEPPELEEPKLPISNLDENSTNSEVANAYAESISILKSELQLRNDLLDSYRNITYPPSSSTNTQNNE